MVSNTTLQEYNKYSEYNILIICTIILPVFTILCIYLYIDFKHCLCITSSITSIVHKCYCLGKCNKKVTKPNFKKKKLDNLFVVENGAFELDSMCSICLDNSNKKNIKLKCNHSFHKDCINKWIVNCIDKSTSPVCPICRHVIFDKNDLDNKCIKNF